MGLDMTAVRKFYVKQSEYQNERARYKVDVTQGGERIEGLQLERISRVEEEVMSWKDASHIHGWFVKNVQDGKDDRGEYKVDNWDLRKLLEVCEKVLESSHLVRGKVFKEIDHDELNRRLNTPGGSPKVIKNVTVASRLLPYQDGYSVTSPVYGEQYLKDVEVTRDWAERMLLDERRGVRAGIYYSSGW